LAVLSKIVKVLKQVHKLENRQNVCLCLNQVL
jgi:hypothetical protein